MTTNNTFPLFRASTHITRTAAFFLENARPGRQARHRLQSVSFDCMIGKVGEQSCVRICLYNVTDYEHRLGLRGRSFAWGTYDFDQKTWCWNAMYDAVETVLERVKCERVRAQIAEEIDHMFNICAALASRQI